MKRLLIAIPLSTAAVLGLSTGAASAGEPANQAWSARVCPPWQPLSPSRERSAPQLWGFAEDPEAPPGLGNGIQLLQAGEVPDEVVPNTSND